MKTDLFMPTHKVSPFSLHHTSEMERIPSDVWRVFVFPCLDWSSRIELNRVLDPEMRVVRRVKVRQFAKRVAWTSIYTILERAKSAKTDPRRVKEAIQYCRFLHTAFGSLLLKTPSFVRVTWDKIAMFESEDPNGWWNKSPKYTPKLKKETHRLRDMLVANGITA